MAKVTIYDIAAQLGVSSSTVARALRGDFKGVQKRSSRRAAQILKAAQEMGYKPNLRARAFAKSQTKGIGLIYSNFAWFFHGVNDIAVRSLEQRLRARGYHLVFVPLEEDGHWKQIVFGGQVDGCVSLQPLSGETRKLIEEAAIPLVSLGGDTDPSVSHVAANDYLGGFDATSHLIGLGHQRLRFLLHRTIQPHYSVQARQEGFWAAAAAAALPRVQVSPVTDEDIEEVICGASRSEWTAVVCYSDYESLLVTNMAWRLGVRIPQQLSVIGFNDIRATRLATPPITTMDFDAARSGSLAALMLLRLLEEPERRTPRNILLKHRLILRQSTSRLGEM